MTLLMKHSGLPDTEPAVTTQDAFDKVWSKKGWEIVPPEEVEVERSRPGDAPAETETTDAKAKSSRRATNEEG
ncbi:hypothetical protein [Cellulomonas taurus]|uniref:hypothetical protein n=1 Tax=Cellulomonas taurus TaxID=2729175 RepID=UPI00145C8477|nr:hypothetical protein [Cellulomonas taurus]